ncbi:hypothetical protein ACOYW6_08125 [Parablastomonas sp. CN1-191]|uniref:hypothetical protein n=1 Tax=Parablastomonas sp. CN1-191 TaxID=3400908 RepID=UPI003BF8274E
MAATLNPQGGTPSFGKYEPCNHFFIPLFSNYRFLTSSAGEEREMKRVALMTALALITAAQPAAGKAASPVELTLSGEGRVECRFEDARGNIDNRVFKPVQAKPASYASDRLDHASCEYHASLGQQLTIAIVGEAWKCPLRSTAEAKCEQVVAPSSAGSFRLARLGQH